MIDKVREVISVIAFIGWFYILFNSSINGSRTLWQVIIGWFR